MTVTLDDIRRAADLLAGRLPATPLWSYPALDDLAGATVWVKHENTQPVGAFKVRGGLTLLAGLPAADRRRGIVTYSTGNHAQSLAYAGRAFGVRVVVVLPAAANEAKVRAVRALGAEVVPHGADLGDAQAHATALAARTGARLVGPADEPVLLAGVGTVYLELLCARPDLDAVLVPVGSGTGAAAACVVAAALAPGCEVIAVQSAAAPAAHDSWRAGRCVSRPNRTAVEGLATGRGFALPQGLMRGLADFVLVDDAAIVRAQAVLATHAHTLAEGAGAAGLAAVLADPDRFAGRRLAVVCTGGNASAAELAALSGAVARPPDPPARPFLNRAALLGPAR
jgi:threonine dehydratase